MINSNGFGQTAASLGDGVYLLSSPNTTVTGNIIEANRDWGNLSSKSSSSVLKPNTFQGNGLGSTYSS